MSRIEAICTSLDGTIHCAGIRYMNAITYTPGESLRQLEIATLSAPYQGWEHTFRLNVLASYFLTAGLIILLGEAAAKGEGRGLCGPAHAGKYRAWCLPTEFTVGIWKPLSLGSRSF
jgi:NAD(P)-dependent dehydrogenase (short-subunit alcohol dehydrogenase family)